MEATIVVGLIILTGMSLSLAYVCWRQSVALILEAFHVEREKNDQLLDRLQSGSLVDYTQAQLAKESIRIEPLRNPADLAALSSNGTRMRDTSGIYDEDDGR